MAQSKATKPRTTRLPQPRVHKRSGRVYATFNGEVVWFGAKDDPETQRRFDAHLAAWLARGRQPEIPAHESVLIRELVARFLEDLERKRGLEWFEVNGCRLNLSMRALLKHFGHEEAESFTPLKFQTLRHVLICTNKLCRSEINARMRYVRGVFEWGVSQELVPPLVHHALTTVKALARGEYGVREGAPRKAVSEADVFEVMEHLAPVPAALTALLWWTGARPGEVLNLRPVDIDRSGATWTATLEKHKTARKGKARTLAFGPRAQEILRRYLDRVPRPAPEKPIFTPELGLKEHEAERRSHRQTPLYKSHVERLERDRARREDRQLSDRYDAGALRRAIHRAIARANAQRQENGIEERIEQWGPYNLRHAALTRIRNEKGLEAAKAVGGHASVLMTEGYSVAAERELARVTIAELG